MREAHHRNSFGASSRISAQFGLDWAKRTVKRSEQGMPVNRDDLKTARRILAGLKGAR